MSYQTAFSEDEIKARIEALKCSYYFIAKQVAELKTLEKIHASRYHSTITKSLDNPMNSKLSTLIDILEVLGGNLVIEWDNRVINESEYNMEKRVEQLEESINDIKLMLKQLTKNA